MSSNALGSPIPLSEIENVLAWVDTFKLSRPTKKINRDFSDAVLLAEMLNVHYPKLVEMHNYPPRNSHALKLNNWMTLNRKVLKKLKLNLCCDTMEQLANSSPGVIERVLVMVREKIKKDEELEKSNKEAEQNMSSGGSYYEACGDDEHVLVVPVKVRVNGVLETLQQKVVSYDAYVAQKNELKDTKDAAELLRQKVEHLDNLIKLKDERISELQKQLERRQARRKEVETLQNSINAPFEEVPPPIVEPISLSNKSSGVIKVPSKCKLEDVTNQDLKPHDMKLQDVRSPDLKPDFKIPTPKVSSTKIPSAKVTPQPSATFIPNQIQDEDDVQEIDRIKSDVFKEAEVVQRFKSDIFKENNLVQRIKSDLFKEAFSVPVKQRDIEREIAREVEIEKEKLQDVDAEEEFKDSEPGTIMTIAESIDREIIEIINPVDSLEAGDKIPS